MPDAVRYSSDPIHSDARDFKRVLMLGTFGMRPKGTMSARAAGIASALEPFGWSSKIVTVPWDNPSDAGSTGVTDGVSYANTRVVRPALWPLAVGEILKQARSFQPDLIHLFKPKGFGDLAARVLRRASYPVIVDMDDWEGSRGWNDVLPYSTAQRRVFDWQERTWPSQASGVTAASEALVHRAEELGAPSSQVLYLPNRLSEARLQELMTPPDPPSRDYGLPSESDLPRVLLYTRFVEFGPEFISQIMKELAAREMPVELIVAGGSTDGRAEERLIRDHVAGDAPWRMRLIGWIAPEDLGSITARCSVALVPFDDTLINRSKCSVKLLELIATGIPVVASAVGENRTYSRMSSNAFLARPDSVTDHADRLIEAIRSSRDGINDPGAAESALKSTASWASMAAEIDCFYRQAVAQGRPRTWG